MSLVFVVSPSISVSIDCPCPSNAAPSGMSIYAWLHHVPSCSIAWRCRAKTTPLCRSCCLSGSYGLSSYGLYSYGLQGKDYAFVSFVLFKRHYAGPKVDAAITAVSLFRFLRARRRATWLRIERLSALRCAVRTHAQAIVGRHSGDVVVWHVLRFGLWPSACPFTPAGYHLGSLAFRCQPLLESIDSYVPVCSSQVSARTSTTTLSARRATCTLACETASTRRCRSSAGPCPNRSRRRHMPLLLLLLLATTVPSHYLSIWLSHPHLPPLCPP